MRDKPFELWEIERLALVSRLRMLKGNREATARSLKVSKGWVYRKIREWQIGEAELMDPMCVQDNQESNGKRGIT